MNPVSETTHKLILKTTAILGGSKIVNIIITIARTKIVAVLLGPIGVGIEGMFGSSLSLISTSTNLGLSFSAVRDISQAAASKNQAQISRTISIFRRWVWLTGVVGMLITILLAERLSVQAFGSKSYTTSLRILSITLLLGAISNGQQTLLNGLRKIKDMAKSSMMGSMLGFILSVPLYYFFGLNGIVPVAIVGALISLYRTWYYTRKIKVVKIKISVMETFWGGLGMARLGFFKVLAGLVGTGTMYLVSIFISKNSGIDMVGHFKAAWALSTIYISIVFDAMSADFYPRISAINSENRLVNQAVNEQIEVALLLGGPIIITMMIFMKWVVVLFYSAKFLVIIPILQFQVLATLIKILTWPLGYILMAKGKGSLWISSELIWSLSYLLIVYLGWNNNGFHILGYGYLAAFIINALFLHLLLKSYTKFKLSKICRYYAIIYIIISLSAFYISRLSDFRLLILLGLPIIAISLFISYRELSKSISITDINSILRRRRSSK